MSTTERDIWKDPRVVDALNEGRFATDICLLECPKCHEWGYYNEGSHFTCLHCDKSWYVCTDSNPTFGGRPAMGMDSLIKLSDTVCDPEEPCP